MQRVLTPNVIAATSEQSHTSFGTLSPKGRTSASASPTSTGRTTTLLESPALEAEADGDGSPLTGLNRY